MRTRTRPVTELEAELALAREQEEADRVEAERAERARLIDRKSFERQMEPRVAAVEKRAKDAAAQVKAATSTSTYGTRVTCRRYLRGQLTVYELSTPERAVADLDPAAGLAVGVAAEAATLLAAMVGPEATVRLVGSPLVDRVDAAEQVAWSAFIGRVRRLAGED